MNKTELVKELAAELSLSRAETASFVNAFQKIVAQGLKRNESVLLQGFGVFSPWQQKERPARNPRTGSACMIQPRLSVKFRPGKLLREHLNPEPPRRNRPK